VQLPQPTHIGGEQVVLDDAPVLGLILRDDRVVVITESVFEILIIGGVSA
jgi:hypothetical protein